MYVVYIHVHECIMLIHVTCNMYVTYILHTYILHTYIHEGRDEAMASGGQIFQDLLAQVAGLTY